MAYQVEGAAQKAFRSIVDRQALVDQAQQEMQLVTRYKTVLGLSSSMQAHCSTCQFNHIMPAYQEATALIQTQAAASPAAAAKWGILQDIMDLVPSLRTTHACNSLSHASSTVALLHVGMCTCIRPDCCL